MFSFSIFAACHSDTSNFAVEDIARGMKRKVSYEESPERATAKWARGSTGPQPDLLQIRGEGQQKEGELCVEHRRVMERLHRSLSSSSKPSAAATSSSRFHPNWFLYCSSSSSMSSNLQASCVNSCPQVGCFCLTSCPDSTSSCLVAYLCTCFEAPGVCDLGFTSC